MISDEAAEAAAWEISAVHYPDYEPDLELARKVLEAAAPHMLAAVWDAGMWFGGGGPKATYLQEVTPTQSI